MIIADKEIAITLFKYFIFMQNNYKDFKRRERGKRKRGGKNGN